MSHNITQSDGKTLYRHLLNFTSTNFTEKVIKRIAVKEIIVQFFHRCFLMSYQEWEVHNLFHSNSVGGSMEGGTEGLNKRNGQRLRDSQRLLAAPRKKFSRWFCCSDRTPTSPWPRWPQPAAAVSPIFLIDYDRQGCRISAVHHQKKLINCSY